MTLADLPSEIILEIASRVPYEQTPIQPLALINRHFHTLLTTYEQSITKAVLETQYPWARRQFPGLFTTDQRPIGRKQIATVHTRIAALSSINARCRILRENNGQQSAWTTKRSVEFHSAGLLLLYRLSDAASSDDQCAILQSLPSTSLAVLLFTLLMSIHMLRSIGPRVMLHCQHHQPAGEGGHAFNMARQQRRSDLELACEELLLQRGPDFLLGLLNGCESTTNVLLTEFLHMAERQMPTDDGQASRPTLIATLRQCFAKAAGCDMQMNLVHMWEVLEDDCTDLVNDYKHEEVLERLVNGEMLDKVTRWCMTCNKMA